MFANANDAIEVATRCAGISRLAFAGNANGSPRIHAPRNVDFEDALGFDATRATACGTGIRNDCARTAASSTGCLHAEKALILNDGAVAVAAFARGWRCPPPGAVSGTIGAKFFALNRDCLRDASSR